GVACITLTVESSPPVLNPQPAAKTERPASRIINLNFFIKNSSFIAYHHYTPFPVYYASLFSEKACFYSIFCRLCLAVSQNRKSRLPFSISTRFFRQISLVFSRVIF